MFIKGMKSWHLLQDQQLMLWVRTACKGIPSNAATGIIFKENIAKDLIEYGKSNFEYILLEGKEI